MRGSFGKKEPCKSRFLWRFLWGAGAKESPKARSMMRTSFLPAVQFVIPAGRQEASYCEWVHRAIIEGSHQCGLMQSWGAAKTSFESLVGLRRTRGMVMDVGNLFLPFLMQLSPRTPTLLVYFVGIVSAIALWRRYPKPCLLVFLAMCLALFAMIGSIYLFMYLPRAMNNFGGGRQEIGIYFTAINIVSSVIHAATIMLLLSAVFVGRSQPPAAAALECG
jgi:hypothetical protein